MTVESIKYLMDLWHWHRLQEVQTEIKHIFLYDFTLAISRCSREVKTPAISFIVYNFENILDPSNSKVYFAHKNHRWDGFPFKPDI